MLNQKLDELQVLIAVHRGSPGGNIIENTIPAFKAAIQQGGDIIELDVIQSTDGLFYIFHDGMEDKLFHEHDNIKTMDSARIQNLEYVNSNYQRVNYKADRLEDVLACFEGQTVMINIDRAWDYWTELLPVLDQFQVARQILLKGPVIKEQLAFLNDYGTKYMFMPIVHSVEDIELTLSYPNLNVVGIELIADTKSHPLFQDDVIQRLHSLDLFVWVNAITLDDNVVLYARLDDDVSVIQNPDLGWGKLFEKKIDIIQTDWPAILAAYRSRKLGI